MGVPPPPRVASIDKLGSATSVWAGERGRLGEASPRGDRLVRPRKDGVLGAGRAAEPGEGSRTARPWWRGPPLEGALGVRLGVGWGPCASETGGQTSLAPSFPAPPRVLAARPLPRDPSLTTFPSPGSGRPQVPLPACRPLGSPLLGRAGGGTPRSPQPGAARAPARGGRGAVGLAVPRGGACLPRGSHPPPPQPPGGPAAPASSSATCARPSPSGRVGVTRSVRWWEGADSM